MPFLAAVLAASCGLDLSGSGTSDLPPESDAGPPGADATPDAEAAAPPEDAPAEAEAAAPPDAGCGDTATDPKNCGECKHDCLGGTCTGGKCDPVNLATVPGARFVALTSTNVYVTGDTSFGGVYELPKSGVPDGGAPLALGTGYSHPYRLAVSGAYVYVGEDDPNGTVHRCAIPGGGCTTLVSNQDHIDGIAADATSFYYADVGARKLKSCALGCATGSPTELGTNFDTPSGVALAGALVVLADKGTGPRYDDGRILTCPIAGCPNSPTQLSINEAGPTFVVAQGNVVYWAGVGTDKKNTAQVKSCSTVACGTPTLIADGQPTIGDLAIDDKNVYWSTFGNGPSDGIYSCPLTGCAGQPKLVANDSDPRGLAVDATMIYWANNEGNLVRRVAK